MSRYQSEATAILQAELCLAHTWAAWNLRSGSAYDVQLRAEYQQYEAIIAARMKLSIELDEHTDPCKYSVLERGLRRRRYKKAMKDQTDPLDEALEQYRTAFRVIIT